MRVLLPVLVVCLVFQSAHAANGGVPTAEERMEIVKVVQALGIQQGKARKGAEKSLAGLSVRVKKAFAGAVEQIADTALKRQLATTLPEVDSGPQEPVATGSGVYVDNGAGFSTVIMLQSLVEAELKKYGVQLKTTEEARKGKLKLADGSELDYEQKREYVPGKGGSVSNSFVGGGKGAVDPASSGESRDRQARAYARGGWFGSAAPLYGMAANEWKIEAEKTDDAAKKKLLEGKIAKALEREEKAKKLAAKLPDGGASNYVKNIQNIARTGGQAAMDKAMRGDWPAMPGDDW